MHTQEHGTQHDTSPSQVLPVRCAPNGPLEYVDTGPSPSTTHSVTKKTTSYPGILYLGRPVLWSSAVTAGGGTIASGRRQIRQTRITCYDLTSCIPRSLGGEFSLSDIMSKTAWDPFLGYRMDGTTAMSLTSCCSRL